MSFLLKYKLQITVFRNIKINYKIIALTLLIVGFNSELFSKYTPPDDCFLKKNERVYIHLQKQVFISGELLNYNAYVVNLSSLKPTNQSKVVYFAIRDTSNRLVMDWRGNLIHGICSGSVLLPDTISSGIYTLSAFTNWMRNISTAYFYNSRILITRVNDDNPEKLIIPLPRSTHKSLISFFPEGGNFVNGLINNVGFRLNDLNELSNILSGTIKDNEGNLLDTLVLSTIGTGKFELKPDTGKVYTAELVTRDKGIINIPLPTPIKLGYTMHVENLPAGLMININSNLSGFIGEKQVYVILHSKGKEIFKSPVSLQNGSGSLLIDKSSLPEGIIYLGILNSMQNIIAKRLVFVEKENKPGIKITKTKSEYNKREKIKMEIETSNFTDNDTLSFSVSVTSVNPFQSYLNNNNIDTYLYLSSEIQNIPFSGKIHMSGIQPDDLLLVTDMNHYAWDSDIENNETNCEYFTEDKGFVLSGNITSNDSLSPDSNAVVLLSCVDSIPWLDYSYTDKFGNFQFLIDKQYDNRNLILQLKEENDTDRKLIWKLDNKYDNMLSTGRFPIYLTNKDRQYLDLNRKIFLVKKIYTQIQEPNVTSTSERSLNFFGDPNYSVYPEDYIALNDFADISANILPGVKFRNKKDTAYLNIVDIEKKGFFTNRTTVLLNGVPLNNLSYLSPLNSKDIKKIDVMESKVIFGDLSFYGIISVQTADGIIPSSYLKKNACMYKNTVYRNSSNQDVSQIKNSTINPNIPDLKQSLYWHPNMTIYANNKITIEFSASDLLSEYEINIQGITNNGIPVSTSTHFTVK